jgi:N-carbamoyl-L-amino-acid hydrolase
VEVDRNGNLWAWWGSERAHVVVTGSHLDTVVNGGAFDGALGVVSGLLAVELLQEAGARPAGAIGVAAFIEEEGARFGIPTLGSRLMVGGVDPASVRALTDGDGVTFAAAMGAAGLDPEAIGPDPDRVARIDAYVELHVEQGVGLVGLGQPVGVISGVWPHGRWRLELTGAADHAGAARLADRSDAVLVLADVIRLAREQAVALGARATIGRIEVFPNTTNTVAGGVRAWLDARAADPATLDALVAGWRAAVDDHAAAQGVEVVLKPESMTGAVDFDAGLSRRLTDSLAREGIDPTEIPTAAGHDAAILASSLPAAMLHVRNPTGVSHSPAEHASVEDCVRGVKALAAVLEDLACR